MKRTLAAPYAIAFRYLKKNGEEVSEHRFGELDLEARRQAAWLLAKGRPGDRVILTHAPGPEFVSSFFACQYAGFIAVPAFPPRRTRHGKRVSGILEDAGCVLALSDAAGRAAMESSRRDDSAWARVLWPKPEDLALPPLEYAALHRPDADDVAFLQYTSGSTGAPKGVMVTHRNLEHNLGLQKAGYGFKPGDIMVSWAPFFHDMGLIMGLLLPIEAQGSGVYFSANDFVQSPGLWLRTLSAYRGTHSSGPNFAYDLCVRSVPEEERRLLDLSHWNYCVNGSEPVKASSIRAFEKAFGPCGVRPRLVQPGYGLAESTLYVAAGTPSEDLLEINEERAQAAARSLVVCGRMPGNRIMIVDALSQSPSADGQVGEIWIQGESVAKGYWRKPQETAETFDARVRGVEDGFLRTGDLGFIHGDRLVISGRLKDLIILRGVNHYPQDLEMTAQSVSPELGTCAAFSVDGAEGERLVLVQETSRHPKTPLADLAAAVIRAVTLEHGIEVSEIVLVPTNAVPRTSSGKVQRRACRAAYLQGGLEASLRLPEAARLESVSNEERLEWIRETALGLGGSQPEAGYDAPLEAWALDSLKIAELCARFQQKFGGDLGALSQPDCALRTLLGSPLPSEAPAQPARDASKTPDPSVARRWRCHPALASIWAFQKSAPTSNAYHISWTAQLSGRPDLRRIEAGLLRLTQSQVALRSGFELDAQSVLWQVEDPAPVALERPWTSAGSVEQARQWAEQWNQKPFDLARPPLWKAAYLPLEDGGSLLAFAFHHIIFDQRSWEAFHESLESLVRDPDVVLEPQAGAPLQGREDVQAQEAARQYWRGSLSGLAPEPWLDHRALARPGAPRVLKAVVPAETVAALRQLASSARCTPFTVAALVWAEALASLSGGDDACFTAPFTLRDQPLSDSQIGYWVHPLPLRLKISKQLEPRERLVEASKVLRGAMSHRQLSLAEAMRCVGLPAPAAVLSYQGELRLPQSWLGSSVRIQPIPFADCKAGMHLEVSGEKAWALNLESHPSAVSEATANRCLRAFTDACRRYAGHAPVSDVSMLKGERLLPTEHRTVMEAFHARVLLDSGATALVYDKGSVDYGTLSAQVRAVAGFLSRAGVKAGERVGVCSQASPAWVAAMMGCFEAGIVYVPLDPNYPAERLKIMLEDSECRLVLSDIERPNWAGSSPWMDIYAPLAARPPYIREPGRPRPEDPAYVIFTSGSSGRPKGVLMNHGAMMNNALGVQTRFNLKPQDRIMQFASISFDPAIQDVLPTLGVGAAVALLQRKGAPGPAELADFIRRHSVSLFLLPTAYWHAFMQSGGAEHFKGIPSLRGVMAGGEAPTPRWVREWNRVLGSQVAFYNVYGPTESCVIVTIFECKPSDTEEPIPLGPPLPGIELAVVGPDGLLLPVGENGELWIAGDSLADGYLSPAGVDRSRFSPASPDGEAMRPFYRTGDLVNLDARGRLVYRGRMDRQIKASGIRVDLEEIEVFLARAEGVSGAVVEAEGSGESLTLRAWVSAQEGMSPCPLALKDWLKKCLHEACIPADIAVLRAFPMSPSGKIDRKALKTLSPADLPGAVEKAEASAEKGQQADLLSPLCAAFSDILNRAVGPEDDFFALGGTSLRAVRLAGEASRRLERNVLVDQIYQASTPRGLAALLGGGTGSKAAGVLVPLAKGPGPDWVLLPPVSGRLACYRGLAGLMEGRCKVWGLDLRQLPAPADGAWDAWVEACVREVESALPDSELVLGGWSMGGLLAADMARVLAAHGRVVRRIVLIDSAVQDPLNNALLLNDPAMVEELIERDLEGGAHLSDGWRASSEEERERYRRHVRALSGFTLKPLEIPVSLVISERTSVEEPRTSWMAWSLMARAGMTCQMVPGDHFSVLSGGSLKRIAERMVLDVEKKPGQSPVRV
ncbi:MAG TPA: amino acid adenylation domain-containing protein [bacterium]|nr:amino acid adenylation domain-containing protein [bacterium]